MENHYLALACVFTSSVLGATGSLFFKKASEQFKFSFIALLKNYYLIIGFGLFGSSLVIYLFGLNLTQLTFIYPLSSLSYVWSLFIGRYFFSEPITKLKVFGVVFIFLGTAFIIVSV